MGRDKYPVRLVRLDFRFPFFEVNQERLLLPPKLGTLNLLFVAPKFRYE